MLWGKKRSMDEDDSTRYRIPTHLEFVVYDEAKLLGLIARGIGELAKKPA